MHILGWRSMEQHVQMQKRMNRTPKLPAYEPTNGKARKDLKGAQIPANLPDRFFNEEGSVDLSKVSGEDAAEYMRLIGIHVPSTGGVFREGYKPEEDVPTSERFSPDEVNNILGNIKG